MTLQRYGTKHPNRKHACISVTFMSRSRQEQQIINSTRHVHVVLWSLFRYPTLECTTPTTPTSQPPSERIFSSPASTPFHIRELTPSYSRILTREFTNITAHIREYALDITHPCPSSTHTNMAKSPHTRTAMQHAFLILYEKVSVVQNVLQICVSSSGKIRILVQRY